jgi:hypothetical protein
MLEQVNYSSSRYPRNPATANPPAKPAASSEGTIQLDRSRAVGKSGPGPIFYEVPAKANGLKWVFRNSKSVFGLVKLVMLNVSKHSVPGAFTQSQTASSRKKAFLFAQKGFSQNK